MWINRRVSVCSVSASPETLDWVASLWSRGGRAWTFSGYGHVNSWPHPETPDQVASLLSRGGRAWTFSGYGHVTPPPPPPRPPDCRLCDVYVDWNIPCISYSVKCYYYGRLWDFIWWYAVLNLGPPTGWITFRLGGRSELVCCNAPTAC